MTLVSVKVTVRVTGKHSDTSTVAIIAVLITICCTINIFSCPLFINGINLYGVEHYRALFN